MRSSTSPSSQCNQRNTKRKRQALGRKKQEQEREQEQGRRKEAPCTPSGASQHPCLNLRPRLEACS